MSQNFEKPNEFWKLCESFTLVEAALLILNIEPEGNENIERKSDKPKGLTAILASLNSAVNKGKLTPDEITPTTIELLSKNTKFKRIDANKLKNWLLQNNYTPPFFFGENTTAQQERKHTSELLKILDHAILENWEHCGDRKPTNESLEGWFNDNYSENPYLSDSIKKAMKTIMRPFKDK